MSKPAKSARNGVPRKTRRHLDGQALAMQGRDPTDEELLEVIRRVQRESPRTGRMSESEWKKVLKNAPRLHPVP